MVDDLLSLMSARRGHFLLESGHHGELWLDVDRLFVQPERVRPFVAQLAERLDSHAIDAVCGPLTGGAFLAQMVAETMGVDFVYADRVAAPSPANELFPVAYAIPPELAEFVHNKRVAVVNDCINAGSAVRGALASLRACNAQPTLIAALLILGDAAAALAHSEGVALASLFTIPNVIWEPSACPRCKNSEPLQNPAAFRAKS